MPSPAGDGAPVHSAGDQLGDHEVPQIMQAAGQNVLGLGDPAGAQQLDRAGAHGHPTLGVGLGVLVDESLPGHADHVPGDQHLPAIQVDIGPAQRAQLAAAGAKHDGQAQEGSRPA